MQTKLIIDRDACRGSGLCVAIAPELFEIAEDGAAAGLKQTLESTDIAIATEAVQACPLRALRLLHHD